MNETSQTIWVQGGAYEFTLGCCFNLKMTGTIEGKEWFSFALYLIGNLIQITCGK